MVNTNGTHKKYTVLIAALAIVAFAAVGVSVWALFLRTEQTVLTPDYAPQQVDKNAEPIAGDDGTKMDAPQGGGAVSLTYSNEVTISITDKKAILFFANPGKSTQDMILQLVIQDTVIIQSGRLVPGKQVTHLDLLKDKDGFLAPGGYNGKFVVLYYNQQSGEKAMLNTEIPVSITVTK